MSAPEKITWAACGIVGGLTVAAVIFGVWTADGRWYTTAWIVGALTLVLFIAGAAQAGARTQPQRPTLPVPPGDLMRWESCRTYKPKEDA